MAGYSSRQSTFTTGDTILAAHSNDEFNQLLASFNATTGHTHDGTAGEGGPVTSIRDIHIKDNDLIVATHGRSFWMIDDLTPLHQLNNGSLESNAILFKPDKSYRLAQSGGWRKPNTLLVGENHPNGVIINYYLKNYEQL